MLGSRLIFCVDELPPRFLAAVLAGAGRGSSGKRSLLFFAAGPAVAGAAYGFPPGFGLDPGFLA